MGQFFERAGGSCELKSRAIGQKQVIPKILRSRTFTIIFQVLS